MGYSIYATNDEQWQKLLKRKCYADQALSCKTCTNGIILPVKKSRKDQYAGGVCDEKYRFVAGLIRQDLAHPKGVEVNTSYCLPSGTVLRKSDETVIFGGCLAGHFGHFISEGMGRLWYVVRGNEDCRIAFVSYHPGVQDWFWDFFELLQIPRERILMVSEPTQFKEILVPEESVHSWGGWFTKEYLLPYQRISQNAGTGNERKVYLTHRSWGKGPRIFYEEYFEKFYQSKGFSVVAPETLSVKDQVRLIAGAEELVATMGTLTHLAVFCKPGTRFTMLARTDHEVLPPQAIINEAAEIQVDIVDVSRSFFYGNRREGAILLGPSSHWKKYVQERFYGDVPDSPNWREACYEYIRAWTEFYANHPSKFAQIRAEDPLETLARMYWILCGKKLDRSKFSKETVLRSMERQMKQCQEREKAMEKQVDAAVRAMEWEKGRPILVYEVHQSGRGWTVSQYEDMYSMEEARVEAFRVDFTRPFHALYYATYNREDGWGKEVSTGEISGTTGQKKAISGMYMRLDADGAKEYSVQYRICSGKYGWSEWVRDNARVWTDRGVITCLEMRCISRMTGTQEGEIMS